VPLLQEEAYQSRRYLRKHCFSHLKEEDGGEVELRVLQAGHYFGEQVSPLGQSVQGADDKLGQFLNQGI
jgi:hypothetical protein